MIATIILTTGEKVFFAVVALGIICFWIFKFYTYDEFEWFSQNRLPENPREDRNISEDVLIYDYDNDCNIIAYYCYNEEKWCFIGNADTPKNWKWRYLDIDIDQP